MITSGSASPSARASNPSLASSVRSFSRSPKPCKTLYVTTVIVAPTGTVRPTVLTRLSRGAGSAAHAASRRDDAKTTAWMTDTAPDSMPYGAPPVTPELTPCRSAPIIAPEADEIWWSPRSSKPLAANAAAAGSIPASSA
jgi:hypothetical protein